VVDRLVTKHVVHAGGGQALGHRELLAQGKLLPHLLILSNGHALLHRIDIRIVAHTRVRPMIIVLLILKFRSRWRIIKRLLCICVAALCFLYTAICLVFCCCCVDGALRRQ